MSPAAERSAPGRIENDAARSEISKIAAYLQKRLGQKPTAYLSGLEDSKTVGQWAAGKAQPRDAASLRLRHAYQAARLIVEAFGDQTAKAWLFGTNSQLGDEAPAFVLRHGRLPEEVAPVVRAARSFAESGRRTTGAQAAGDADEARQQGARRLARLLVSEIKLYEKKRIEGSTLDITSEIREELLEGGKQPAERIRALELAQREITERLKEVVERLKSDLTQSSERVGR